MMFILVCFVWGVIALIMFDYKKIFMVLFLALLVVNVSVAYSKEFLIFDLITAINKPDDLPLVPMHMIYQWQGYGGRYTTEDKKSYVDSIPEDYVRCCYVRHNVLGDQPEYYSIDFEQWALYNISSEKIKRNIDYYQRSFDLFREALPKNAKISWYNIGALPNGKLLRKKMSVDAYSRWQKKNNRLMEIVRKYDYMQPSLYLSNKHNMSMWKNKAKAYIDEHTRLGQGKPVYAHLSPQYVDDPDEMLSGKIWREMLEFSYQHADGVVIWTFPQQKHRFSWNDSFPWWVETKLFLERVKD